MEMNPYYEQFNYDWEWWETRIDMIDDPDDPTTTMEKLISIGLLLLAHMLLLPVIRAFFLSKKPWPIFCLTMYFVGSYANHFCLCFRIEPFFIDHGW